MGNDGRRRTTFPYGPLDFCDRTRIPTGRTEGAEFLPELSGPEGLLLFRLLRLVVSFARGEYDRGWFPTGTLQVWEEELLRSPGDRRLYAPVAVIVGELIDPEQAEMSQVAHACWCIVEWASDRSPAAAVAFAEAAALSWPANPRNALAAGRLIRQAGRAREGEIWIRRARRLAAHYRDWECLVLSTSSLGMLHFDRGNHRVAAQHLERASRIARRHHLRVLEGEVLHNQLGVATIIGDLDSAERFGLAAFERYLPYHPKLPALAYDVAYLWLSRGNATRALQIFHALLPHFSDPAPRVQVLCAMCRAAGLAEDRELFTRCASEVVELSRELRSVRLPAALLDLARGAADLGDRNEADNALRRARALAVELGQPAMAIEAEEVENHITRGSRAYVQRPIEIPERERFASRFAFVLTELAPAG